MSNSILFKNRNCALNPPAFTNLRPGLRHHTAAPSISLESDPEVSRHWSPPHPPAQGQAFAQGPPAHALLTTRSQLWVLQQALSSRSSRNLDVPEGLTHWALLGSALPPLSRPSWGKEFPWESKPACLAGTQAHSYQQTHHWELAEGCPFSVQFHGPALSLQARRGPTQPALHREHCCPALPLGAVAGTESTLPTSRLQTPARAEAPAGTVTSAAWVTARQDSTVLGAELALPLPARFLEKDITAAPTSSSCSAQAHREHLKATPVPALPHVQGSSYHMSWARRRLLTWLSAAKAPPWDSVPWDEGQARTFLGGCPPQGPLCLVHTRSHGAFTLSPHLGPQTSCECINLTSRMWKNEAPVMVKGYFWANILRSQVPVIHILVHVCLYTDFTSIILGLHLKLQPKSDSTLLCKQKEDQTLH